MVSRFVLDTNVALYLLADRIDPLPTGECYTSFVTELELLSYPGITPAEEQRVREFLDAVCVVGFDERIKEQTIGLRRVHRLRLPDALVAATAVTLDAALLTADQRLLGLRDVKTVPVSVRPA